MTVAQRTCLGQRAGHEDRTGAGVAPEAACTWGRLAERAFAREAEPISKRQRGRPENDITYTPCPLFRALVQTETEQLYIAIEYKLQCHR